MGLRIIFGVLLTLFSVFFVCCGDGEDSSLGADYTYYRIGSRNWKSHRLVEERGGIVYAVSEVPLAYHFLRSGYQGSSLDSLCLSHADERLFEVEFSSIDGTDLFSDGHFDRDLGSLISHLSFEISDDFSLSSSVLDSLDCSGSLFERSFKLTPHKRVLLFFSGVASDQDFKLIYRDRLFGRGVFEFDFGKLPLKV